jgi:hypothetical protein
MNSTTLVRGNNRSIDETDRLLQQKDIELKKMQELIAKMKTNMNVPLIHSNNKNHNNHKSNNLVTFGQKVPVNALNTNTNTNINSNINRVHNILNNHRNINENPKVTNIISYQSITPSNSTSI